MATLLIRHKVHGERPPAHRNAQADLDALACFIAGSMMLARQELEGGLFRNGAKELHFLDGRASKRLLAVTALDLECTTAVLADPAHAARIRSRFYRVRAQRLKARAVVLKDEAEGLRREVKELRAAFERQGNRV